jgi:hypothetical protein
MICINANIPKEFNEFIEKTKRMNKADRKIISQKYQS